MLLIGKHWVRIAGAAFLLLVILFYLNTIHAIGFDRVVTLPEQPEESHAQEKPYHPQDEVQGAAGITRLEASQAVESTTEIPSVTSTPVAENLFIEGTRKPESVLTTTTAPDGLPILPSETTETETPTPTSTGPRKAIVMGKLSSEDTDWVKLNLFDWESYIYVVDLPANETSPTGLRTKINKSKEATPYLNFIFENYESLPDVAVFLHAHRDGWPQAWHNEGPGYDAVKMMKQLQLNAVQEHGYLNLRCDATIGCPAEMILERNPQDPTRHAEHAYPIVYGQFFNLTVQEVKQQVPIIATPCCAQFAVSKEQILKRPRSDYERYLKLIEESEYDDETLGRVMEYMWHILFGQDAVHCPDANECYGTVYGKKHGWGHWG